MRRREFLGVLGEMRFARAAAAVRALTLARCGSGIAQPGPQIFSVAPPASKRSHFMRLARRDFVGWLPLRGRWTRGATISRVCDEVERLRARAIAARYRYLIDNFCDLARDEGMNPAVQPEQWILLSRTDRSRHLVVVPAVGIPTSDRIHQIFEAIPDAIDADIWMIFDNRGVLKTWLTHLEWLDIHLPIRAVQMARTPVLLREFNA
jgi:hypothetical protein